jgi:hypothetical protein
MTAFGKLLVFMNLLFSVVTGALIVFVFTTRANWKTAYDDAKVKAESAEKAYKFERASHENDLKGKDAASAGLQSEVTQLKALVATAQAEAQRANDLAAKMSNVNGQATTDTTRLQAELAQIREEREKLDKEKTALRDLIVKVQSELGKQREVAVLADLRARNMEQKAFNLIKQVEELTGRNRELEQQALTVGTTTSGSSGPSILEGTLKSAPPGVRGRITAVGTTGTALAQVNIGSDSGLSTGNVLIVFRGAEYLGDLTLTSVNPKESVGKFNPAKRTSTIQKDDMVITSFSGSPQ